MTRSERFEVLQAKWRDADRAVTSARAVLNARYQSHQYAPAVKRRALEVLERKERRASESFTKLLIALSPRDWRSGVPVSYLRDGLTYADAITRGQLSTIPPAAWGYTPRDSEVFSWPLPEVRA